MANGKATRGGEVKMTFTLQTKPAGAYALTPKQKLSGAIARATDFIRNAASELRNATPLQKLLCGGYLVIMALVALSHVGTLLIGGGIAAGIYAASRGRRSGGGQTSGGGSPGGGPSGGGSGEIHYHYYGPPGGGGNWGGGSGPSSGSGAGNGGRGRGRRAAEWFGKGILAALAALVKKTIFWILVILLVLMAFCGGLRKLSQTAVNLAPGGSTVNLPGVAHTGNAPAPAPRSAGTPTINSDRYEVDDKWSAIPVPAGEWFWITADKAVEVQTTLGTFRWVPGGQWGKSLNMDGAPAAGYGDGLESIQVRCPTGNAVVTFRHWAK